ncbi:MAG: serine/threonine-protein kinase [Cyanobacteria bacterium J06642_9]
MTNLSDSTQQQAWLGPYQVQQELRRNREGGRITYLATQSAREQQVVLKQFRFVQTETSWAGFKNYEREIAILQAIDHPQVPRYLDSFETEDGFCMVQEYKDAPPLAERYHLSPEQVQQVAISVLEILADLQQQVPPIIHRDLKPENILVDCDLRAYLIDFGLAKLTHDAIAVSSIAAGTPGFMPPEELFNRPLNTAADLYSLGATLISLLTQIPSAQITELIDETYRFNFKSHLPPINPRFIDWLQKMVAPNPRDRFPDAATALASLKTIDINDCSPPSSNAFANPADFMNHQVSPKVASLAIVGLLTGVSVFTGAVFRGGSSLLTAPPPSSLTPEQQWFASIKPRCNALEVITAIQNNPYPETPVGVGLGASCYTLAGKLPLADQAIQSLPEASRIHAASVLFDIGHPVADQGDDESAGPIMDLVLKYWPENYMALYHAGMSAYVLADNDKAVEHLERFLQIYQTNDGWRQKAILAIENIEQGIPADDRFKVHH